MSRKALSGIGVLVTRPAGQSANLASLVNRSAGRAIVFPTIEIVAGDEPAVLRAAIGDDVDIAIFVSVNAVDHGAAWFDKDGSTRLAAIGEATARRLRERGLKVSIRPHGGYTSEALLKTRALQGVSGHNVVIVQAPGGRTLLHETLKQRGAEVRVANVYRRRRPQRATGELERRWEAGEIDVVTATSVATLDNLHAMLSANGRKLLRATRLVTASSRVVKRADELGLADAPLMARAPDDEAIVAAVIDWARTRKQRKDR